MRQGKPRVWLIALVIGVFASSAVAGVKIQGIDVGGKSLGANETTSSILVKLAKFGGSYENARVGMDLPTGAFLSSQDESVLLTISSDQPGKTDSTMAIAGTFRIAIAPSSAEGLFINLLNGTAVSEGSANSGVNAGEAGAASVGTVYQVRYVATRGGFRYDWSSSARPELLPDRTSRTWSVWVDPVAALEIW